MAGKLGSTWYGKTPQERFDAKWLSEPNSGCFIWIAKVNRDGYGQFAFRQGMQRAHRVAWILAFGKIPEGKEVCHSCDNPSCVRLEHLFLGSHDDNMKNMAEKGRWRGHRGQKIAAELQRSKTRCKSGHSLSGDNLYVTSQGKRGCRICRKRRSAEYYQIQRRSYGRD